MQLLVDFAVNDRGTYAKFIKKAKPILLSMYNDNEVKVNELIELSKAFRRMLKSNKINEKVMEFIWISNRFDANTVRPITTPKAFRLWNARAIEFARRR